MSQTLSSLRATTTAGGLMLVLMVGGIGGWAATTEIAGAVIASGVVSVPGSAKSVQHLEGGIIAELHVRDSSYVKAGELLVQLDQTDAKANVAIIEGQRAELLAEQARLEAQRDMVAELAMPAVDLGSVDSASMASIINGQQRLLASLWETFEGKKHLLEEQIAQIEEQIGGLRAQLAGKRWQRDSVQAELVSLRSLREQGLVEISRVMAAERQAAVIDGDVGQLRSEIARLGGTISETRLRIVQEDEQWRGEALTALGQTRVRLASLNEQRLAAVARLARTAITAPLSGFVHELAVHTVGGVIVPGEQMMLIVPETSDLVVNARINPRDIDQISVGQAVRLRFNIPSQRLTPELHGTVTVIAADVTQDRLTGLDYYPIEVVPNPGETKKTASFDLRPGMPVEVFVQTGMRSALTYLTSPLVEQLTYAFRE